MQRLHSINAFPIAASALPALMRPVMQNSLWMLLAGVVLAWFGGEFFVRGGVGLARWLRWPSAVIGVTVAAFGTSTRTLTRALSASSTGSTSITFPVKILPAEAPATPRMR